MTIYSACLFVCIDVYDTRTHTLYFCDAQREGMKERNRSIVCFVSQITLNTFIFFYKQKESGSIQV